ncbi:MAG: oligosaccharide flippase family protein [bacterium]|nr:oligosaccharide flippase family protein [bacterium]
MKDDTSDNPIFSLEVARGYIFSSLWGNIGKILGFANSLIVIYFLTVNDFGIYKLVLAFIGFVQILLFSGFDGVVFNDIARARGEQDDQKANRIFSEYLWIKVFLGSLLFLGTLLLSPYLSILEPTALSLVKIASALLLLYALADIVEVFFKATSDFKWLFGFPPLYELVKLISLIIIITTVGLSVELTIWSGILAYVVALVPFFVLNIFRAKAAVKISWDWNILRFTELTSIFKAHGKWSIANNIFSNFVTNVRPWLIRFFLGIEAVGIYSVAASFVGHLNNFLGLQKILGILAPREWENKERMKKIFSRGTKYATIVAFLIVVSGTVGVVALITVFYPKYTLSLVPFVIMVISLLYTPLSDASNGILTIVRAQRFLFWQAIWKSFLTLALNIVFLPIFGISGAALEYFFNGLILTSFKYRKVKNIDSGFVLRKDFFTIDRYDKNTFKQVWGYFIGKLMAVFNKQKRN